MFNKRKTYFKLLLSICYDLLTYSTEASFTICNVSVCTLIKLSFLTNIQFPRNILTIQYRTICARLHRVYKTDVCIGKEYKEIDQNVRLLISGLWDYGLFLFFSFYIFKFSTVSLKLYLQLGKNSSAEKEKKNCQKFELTGLPAP